MIGGGMGVPRHDGEVKSVVMEYDAVLALGVRGRARYSQAHTPKRRRHHRVPRVSQGCLLRHDELFDFLYHARIFFIHTPPRVEQPPLCISLLARK